MLHSPWWLLLLVVLPVLAWRFFSAKRRGSAISFSNTAFATEMTPTLRQRLLWLPQALFLLALLFLVISLARPREGREQTITESEGIAIEMIVDRSGSMRALDFKIGGEHVDRLTAIKNVAAKFVMGDESLDGRFSDLVGLITFAGYADGVTPPTLDHGFLTSSLNQTEIASARGEDGTAIGDAIALAVEKLTALDEKRDDKVKSKIIILLTDGENTAGELEPIAAAELAETLGIKIYTIGVGTQGQAPIPVRDAFTGRQRIRMMPVNIDEATLKKVADVTGGKYFRAVDTDSLTEIYKEIDKLEKTKVETENFVDYSELAVQGYRDGSIAFWPTLVIAFSLLATSVVLQNSWLRETS
jgi:Ca-activated chloride channel family protein